MQTTVVMGTPLYPDVDVAPAGPTPPPPAPPGAQLQRRHTMMAALQEMGWPSGLTKCFATSVEQFPVRFVVVDNSGSMQSMDGSRLVKAPNGAYKSIRSTRWQELGDVVNEMAQVAQSLGATTHFHMLNPSAVGQYFALADDGSCCVRGAGAPCNAATMKSAMATSPGGTTPLTENVMFISSLIAPHIDQLRAQGQKVVVVLATDGLPNDPASFLRALQELQRLPVWLVVRLCTDEDHVVQYWSDLDAQLESPLETLDDVHGEANEVFASNPWLTYAPSLHLARTMGLQDKLFDLLDEQPLLPSQAKVLLEKVLACPELPEPEVDLKGFMDQLKAHLNKMPKVYNPVKKAMTPWVDMNKLYQMLTKGKGGCVVS